MAIVVSAPGKVLLAGGYLVLDPKYSGVVVSTSSRFYSIIRPATTQRAHQIIVKSPQFLEATWGYDVVFGSKGEIGLRPFLSKSVRPNKHVVSCIGAAL